MYIETISSLVIIFFLVAITFKFRICPKGKQCLSTFTYR
jgi:hypothetical protein